MENELFDDFFGPPMNIPIPTPTPNNDGTNFVLIGGSLVILFLLYKLNAQKKEKE